MERLRVQRRTGFALDPRGRLLAVNSPDRPRPPRFVLAECVADNLSLYSSLSNSASQSVAARLGLAAFGVTLSVP